MNDSQIEVVEACADAIRDRLTATLTAAMDEMPEFLSRTPSFAGESEERLAKVVDQIRDRAVRLLHVEECKLPDCRPHHRLTRYNEVALIADIKALLMSDGRPDDAQIFEQQALRVGSMPALVTLARTFVSIKDER